MHGKKGVCVATAQAALLSEEDGGTANQAMAASAQSQQQPDECDVRQGKGKSGAAGPAMAGCAQSQQRPDECDLHRKGGKNGAANLLKKLAKFCVSAVKGKFENFDLSNISRDKNLNLLIQQQAMDPFVQAKNFLLR